MLPSIHFHDLLLKQFTETLPDHFLNKGIIHVLGDKPSE